MRLGVCESKVDRCMAAIREPVAAMSPGTVGDSDLSELVRLAGGCFSKKPLRTDMRAAAWTSLSHLRGQRWNTKLVMRNMNRLVANWDFIREGMEIPRWDGSPVVADMLVIGVRGLPGLRYGDRWYDVLLKLKTGLCAGIITCAGLSTGRILDFLKLESGCSRYDCAAEELSGMRLQAAVSMDSSGLSRLRDMQSTEAQRKHNRDLTERRSDPEKCSYAPRPCNTCECTVRDCPLAVWLPMEE